MSGLILRSPKTKSLYRKLAVQASAIRLELPKQTHRIRTWFLLRPNGPSYSENLLPKPIPHNHHSRLTWRVRNALGYCPAFLSAAKAPGVATIWPSSKVRCLLTCCIGKNSFRWFRFVLLRGPAESGALKANALAGGARRLAGRAVKAALFSRSSVDQVGVGHSQGR